ncbi:Hypothetical protein KVN_LOCUS25 [uncultured virus]|nr:Hypothetical protein KVN_LOCUS25 [uncultured virus]
MKDSKIQKKNSDIININATGGKIQTTYQIIKLNEILLESIDENNNISLDIKYKNMKKIINYFRGYYSDKILWTMPVEAKKLGLKFEINGFVYLNISGKHYYMSKQFLISRLEFFELFFKYNSKFDPDYSKILIDRCDNIFDDIMKYISYKHVKFTKQIEQELLFYGLKKYQFIDTEQIKFFSYRFSNYKIIDYKIDKSETSESCIYLIVYNANEEGFQIDDNKKILCQIDQNMKKKELFNLINIKFDSINQNIENLILNKVIKYDKNLKLLLIQKSKFKHCEINLSKKINLKSINLLEKMYENKDNSAPNSPDYKYSIKFQIKQEENTINFKIKDIIEHDKIKFDLNIKNILIFKKLYLSTDNSDFILNYIELKKNDIIFCKSNLLKRYDNCLSIEALENKALNLDFLLTNQMECEMIIHLSRLSNLYEGILNIHYEYFHI